MRSDRLFMAAGAVLFGAGVLVAQAVPAGATFPGTNGKLVWSNDCGNGQALWTATYTSSGLLCPFTAETAGAADAMPYFNAAGSTVYFASNRGGNFGIWSAPYPNTVSGSNDNAVQLTNQGNSGYDYTPTVDTNEDLLTYIHCTTTTGGCNLDTKTLPGGTVTQVDTSVTVAPPNNVNGDGNRPETDPANPALILYVGTDGHIHEMTLSAAARAGGTDSTDASTDIDLSSRSGVGTASDEHPDWAGDGQAIVFDSSRGGLACSSGSGTQPGNTAFTMTNLTAASPTAALVWGKSPCNGTSQIEPVYAPSPAVDVSNLGTVPPTLPLLAWVTSKAGANISVDDGSLANDDPVTNVTQTHNNNAQVVWQPVPLGTVLPEAPLAALIPGGGVLALALGVALNRRRRRPTA